MAGRAEELATRERSLEAAQRRLASELPGRWPARRYGRLAGLLILAAVVSSLPSYFFAEGRFGVGYWVVAVVAVAMAIACFRAPWERLPASGFYLASAATIALTIAATKEAGFHAEIFYVFIVIFVSFVFETRRAIAVCVGACGLALLAPLIWEASVHDGVDRTLFVATLDFPALIVIAAVLVYVRESYESERRRLDQFAGEVNELTERLEQAGHLHPPGGGRR